MPELVVRKLKNVEGRRDEAHGFIQIIQRTLEIFWTFYFDQMWECFSAHLKSKAFVNSYIPF